MRTRWLVGLTGAALGLLGVQASAHHGWAGQQQEQSEITGKLKTDVDLSGPHGSMQIVDDKGQGAAPRGHRRRPSNRRRRFDCSKAW